MAPGVPVTLFLFPLILLYLDPLPVSAWQKNKNICHLDLAPGECLAYIPKWYYNPKSQMCELFIYGGCGGNDNRFDTQKQCQKACSGPDMCKLPLKVGSCNTPKTRWYYDWSEKKCKEFLFWGCDGNLNNFIDMKLCEITCLRE